MLTTRRAALHRKMYRCNFMKCFYILHKTVFKHQGSASDVRVPGLVWAPSAMASIIVNSHPPHTPLFTVTRMYTVFTGLLDRCEIALVVIFTHSQECVLHLTFLRQISRWEVPWFGVCLRPRWPTESDLHGYKRPVLCPSTFWVVFGSIPHHAP